MVAEINLAKTDIILKKRTAKSIYPIPTENIEDGRLLMREREIKEEEKSLST